MSQITSKVRWNERVQEYGYHACLHDKFRPNQAAMKALWAREESLIRPEQAHCAYESSLQSYVSRVQVVGAEPNADEHQISGVFSIPQDRQIIVCIRGFPDHSIIQYLGRRFQLDPHILLSHMPYPPSFSLRSLTSTPTHVINIPFISLGFYALDGARMHVKQSAIDSRVRLYNQTLFENHDWRYQQCHYVNKHGSQFFSVEQKVNLIICLNDGLPFTTILLNNCGEEYSSLPWYPSSKHESPRFLPIKQYGTLPINPAYLRESDYTPSSFQLQRPDPFHSRLHQGLAMSHEEQRLCLQDPMILVTDLFKTSAMAWRQFYSCLLALHEHSQEEDPALNADQFHREKQIIDRSCSYFEDAIGILEHRNALGWPTCSSSKDQDDVNQIISQVRHDYEILLGEATKLSQQCASFISLEMNKVSIRDAKESIKQAERTRLLTFLAYLFLPLSFVAAVFGMNVTEITTPNPPIWKFIAVACPTTLLCALIPIWADTHRLLVGFGNRLRAIFQDLALPR